MIKQYILNKYAGFIKVETKYLQYELLLSKSEFLILKQKIKGKLNITKMPTYLPLDLFAQIIADELGIES